MTVEFTLNQINRQWLEWTVEELPVIAFVSPSFWYQGAEAHFVLYGSHENYCINMESYSKEKLQQVFDVISFIDFGYGVLRFAYRVTIDKIPYRIGTFCFGSCEQRESFHKLTFVFIFEGDNELALDLGMKKEPMKLPTPRADSCLDCLSNDFGKLLDEGSYHDMEFQCPENIIKAHKSVVSTRSDVFSAMLQSEMVEGQTGRIKIPDMDSNLFKQFLRFMYTGQLPEMTSESARCFYEAADKYAVKSLMKPCSDFLNKNLTHENACAMLTLADAHNDLDLKNSVIAYILENDIPLQEDNWQAFSDCYPKLAVEVLHLFYTKQKHK